MFQRFHAMKDEREGGFTLIELLVVILIIAILAAIAIPVFLRQREKGWISQSESSLKNAQTAQESYLVANGTYADTVAKLETEGFKQTSGVTLTIVSSSTSAYCMKADHASLTADYYLSADSGKPSTTACT